jgi:hypothetical protein
MTDKLIYPFRIPDSFFLPHKVTSPFYAKVIYKVVKGRPVVEEVGLSPKCLTYINNTAGMMTRIDGELLGVIRKAASLNNLNTTIAAALAPHI